MRAARGETLSGLPTNHSSADGNLSFFSCFLILVFSVNIFVVVSPPSAHSNTPNASQHHIMCSAGSAQGDEETRRRGGAGGFFYFSQVWFGKCTSARWGGDERAPQHPPGT